MMTFRTANSYRNNQRSIRRAFTLVEVLVALAVMMLMMTIILVPINMGLDLFHIGKARSEVQQANQLVINQLASELKRAVHVFPNEEMPGVTTVPPYKSNGNKPYYSTSAAALVSNTARLDFLLPIVAANGSILTPPQPNNYLITYYARRLNPSAGFDVYSNPIVLWRAQYPYRKDDGTAASTNVTASRYPVWDGTAVKAGSEWLTQANGEPNLTTQSTYTADAVAASHTQITPRDMALVAPNATAATPDYQPSSSFITDDANNDGTIDRVTISLLLAKYDAIGAAGDKRQQIRSTQTVALPNVE